MKYTIILILLLLVSCAQHTHHKISSKPITLANIQGKYLNKGSLSNGNFGGFFSSILFPEINNHDEIEIIKVKITDKKIIWYGYNKEIEIIKKEYLKTKDFEIKENAMVFSNSVGCFSCGETGAMHVGVSQKGIMLYLTDSDDIILRFYEKGIILILLLPIPAPVITETDILFKKIF